MLKAVIFDVDGTLAETEEVHRKAFNTVFEQTGLDWFWSPEEYRELLKVTGGKERIKYFVEKQGLTNLSDADILSLHRLKTVRYAELLPTAVTLRPGVTRLIEECIARSIKLAIATTTTEANVDALNVAVDGAIHLDRFDVVMTGTQVQSKKPDPAVYFATLDALGLKSSEVVAIEDANAGVTAANLADIACVGSHSLYTMGHDLTGANVIVEHLNDRGDGKPVTLEFLSELLNQI